MKRIVLTVMALLLCFMLLGCAKEPVKTDLPKIEETVTPSEIETPETPVESEQPTTPTELTKPEQPTKLADEPTQTEEKGEQISNSPSKDTPDTLKQIIEISIDYTNDFPVNIKKQLEEFYSFPDNYSKVTPKEFSWGRYLPVVTYCCGITDSRINIIETALLSGNANTIEIANELYKTLPENTEKIRQKSKYSYEPYIELNGIKYEIVVKPKIDDNITIEVLEFIDSKYLVLSVWHHGLFYDCTYLYDIETKITRRLKQYMCSDISLSPDGKYLVYSSPDSDNWLNNIDVPEGFYVENLETGELVYYSCEGISPLGHSSYNIVGWIDSQEYINSQK